MRSAKIKREVLMALAMATMCATPWQSHAESDGWTNYIPGGE